MIEVIIFVIGILLGFLVASYGAKSLIERNGFIIYKGKIIKRNDIYNELLQEALDKK